MSFRRWRLSLQIFVWGFLTLAMWGYRYQICSPTLNKEKWTKSRRSPFSDIGQQSTRDCGPWEKDHRWILRFPWLSVWRRFAGPDRGEGLTAEDTEVEIWCGRGSWSLSGRENLGQEEGTPNGEGCVGLRSHLCWTPSWPCAVCDVRKPLRSTAQQLPELPQS